MPVLLSDQVQTPRSRYAVAQLRAASRAQLASLGLAGSELSVVLVSDRSIRVLNRQYRGKDKPTDVLSFPQAPAAAGRRPAGGPIGDVVISLETARRQAAAGGWPLSAELRRLVAHGLLHCLGHDHEDPHDARRMAAAERRLLGEEGMVGRSLAEDASRFPRPRRSTR